jgi:uncharacterized protein YaiE (UPF0345 family)
MNYVQSKNIGVFMKISGVYYPIFCGQTLEFNSDQEEIETTNVNSGSARDFVAGMQTSSMSIGGVTVLNNNGNRIADGYLFQQSVRRVKQEFKITKVDDDGGLLVYTFTGIIKSIGFSKQIPSYSKSSLNVIVCGNVTISTVNPPSDVITNVYSDWWVFTQGSTEISGNSSTLGYNLVGAVVLEVDREGLQHDLIQSGVPVNRQVKHNTGTGVVSFDVNNPSNGETVFVLFRK